LLKTLLGNKKTAILGETKAELAFAQASAHLLSN